MPLDRVWFLGLAVLNRVYNVTHLCSKQRQNLSLTGCDITSQATLTGHDKVINKHQITFWTRMLSLSLNISSISRIDRIDRTDRSSFVVLYRVGCLGYFCPKQGQDFKPWVAPLCPNMGKVPPPPVPRNV